jgi:hypothetical protein
MTSYEEKVKNNNKTSISPSPLLTTASSPVDLFNQPPAAPTSSTNDNSNSLSNPRQVSSITPHPPATLQKPRESLFTIHFPSFHHHIN